MGILLSALVAGYGGYKLGEKLDRKFAPDLEPFKLCVPVFTAVVTLCSIGINMVVYTDTIHTTSTQYKDGGLYRHYPYNIYSIF